ncbi:hypothetical protein BKA83DRAFT_4486147 [Pisolithus microcarpus]|nr:hypothetical protein BKA83DRAFT_4486147 [Pisolithus microcarpus]
MSAPMINAPSHPSTCIRPVGLVLATPSNSSLISDDGLTIVPLKCKHSEDIVKVYLQKKITLQAPLEGEPRICRVAPLKQRRIGRSFSVHPPLKVARLAPLGGEPSDHQVDQVPLKRKRSAEFLELHRLNKVARVAVQGIDMPSPVCPCSNEVGSNDWQNLQGCNPNQKCFPWSFPSKLLIAIATHLPRNSLRTLSQVCRLLQEVAAPLFFQLVHFEPSQAPTSLHVESDMLGALLVWRRTNAFVMPDSIWFSVTGATTDRHLQALSIFFESLQGREPMPRVHLQLPTAPRQPSDSFIRLLDSIRTSGCTDLHCHDVKQTYGVSRTELKSSSFTGAILPRGSKLEVIELTSSLFFSPIVIPFTITTLCSSPITRLTLMNTSLTTVQWTTLLKHLSLQHLLSLAVDSSCPIQSLVGFLAHHNVKDLVFSRGQPTSTRSPRVRVCLPLPSLEHLDGPPACIQSLASLAKLPTTLESLTIRFHQSSLSDIPLLEDVLACAAHFPDLRELCV